MSNLNLVRLSCCWVGVWLGCDNKDLLNGGSMCIMVLSASDAFINWAILLFDRILSILFRCDRILIFLELDWGGGWGCLSF